MVEAAGQLVCLFQDRLDYAFTPAELPGAERLIRIHLIPLAEKRERVASNPSAGSTVTSSAGL